MASVIKSADAEIFWEGIGPKGRHMYIRTSEEDPKYEDYQWQDMPKPVRQSISRQMNTHYRKPKLPKGAWRGVEANKRNTYGAAQTSGITGGEEGTTVPDVKILHPKKKDDGTTVANSGHRSTHSDYFKERENGTKQNVKQQHLEEKIAPIIGAAVGAGAAIAGRAVAGAALRHGKKIISGDGDDEEKAVVNKPFGKYKNWKACKADGKSDEYCGWLKSKLEKKENNQLLIEAIQKNGGGIPESSFQSNEICPCSLQGTIVGNKAIVKHNNLVSFIMLDDRSSSGQMETINKYNPAGGSYYEDPNIIKVGDQVIYAGGEGQIITLTGNYVTILKEDKTKDMVHIKSVIRKTDIIYTEKHGLTCWNGIGAGERQSILQKCKIPLSFISKDWVEIPMNLKNVVQAKFGQPVAKQDYKCPECGHEFDEEGKYKDHMKTHKDKEKKKQALETSDVGVDTPVKDQESKQEHAYDEARTLFFEIKDIWGGSADLGRFVRDHRENERKYNKNWLLDLQRKINNAIKLGLLYYKDGVLSIVDTTKAETKKKRHLSKDGADSWPNYGDAGDAGNRDNATQQGAGQDYSSNVKKPKKKAQYYCTDCNKPLSNEKTALDHANKRGHDVWGGVSKQIRFDDKERKDRKDGTNISEHDKADANMTSDTSGVNNPVYGGEEKPKKKKGIGGVVREVAVASTNQAIGTGLVQEKKPIKPKKPTAGKQTGTKPTNTTESTSKRPVRKWTVGVPENVSINGITRFVVKEEIEIDEIAEEFYRPIEQDANFQKPDRSHKPDKTPKADKPPKMQPQSYAGAYRA